MKKKPVKRRPRFNPNPLNQPIITPTWDGWIPFTQAQPPFDRPVFIRGCCAGSGMNIIGLGRRTKEIDPKARQEIWKCVWLDQVPANGAIHSWKPMA